MNQPAPRPTFSQIGDALEEEVSKLAVSLIRRKPKAEREPSRFPLIVIGIAAFLLLTVLDLISAILVGTITNGLYGFLVFAIGVGSLSIAEVGWFFAYADTKQKVIAIVDIVLSIGSTLLVGALAAIVNAMKYFNSFDASGIQGPIEIGMLVSLVVIGVLHAVLFLSYVFIDSGVQRNQRHQQNKAQHQDHLQAVNMSQESAAATINMARTLQGLIRAGQGNVLRQTMQNLTGEDLLGDLDLEAIAQAPSPNGQRPTTSNFPKAGPPNP